MPIRYVLFDFDGTIADTNEIINICMQLTAKHGMDRELRSEEIQYLFGRPLHEQCAYFHKDRVEELVEFFRKNYMERRDSMTTLFPGIYELLNKLKKNDYKLGVVSNKNSAGLQHGFELLDIGKFFDTWISSEDVKNKKPHPDPVYMALDTLREDDGLVSMDQLIEQTVLVGDSIHDVECGKNAKCKTILVEWTSLNSDKIMELGPDFVASTPEDIFKFVAGQS